MVFCCDIHCGITKLLWCGQKIIFATFSKKFKVVVVISANLNVQLSTYAHMLQYFIIPMNCSIMVSENNSITTYWDIAQVHI